MKRFFMLAALLLIVVGVAHSERVSRAASGTAPCGDDKAVRVLAIGGELQPNSWCKKTVVQRDNTGKVIEAKTKQQERDAFKATKDAELQRKKQLDTKERERKEREAHKKLAEVNRRLAAEAKRAAEAKKKREQECRGLGRGADCTGENPGQARR